MRIRSSERWQKIESIFASALPLSREARDRYLDESCGDDPELKAELQQLLDANEEAGEFLERLDVTAAARLLDTASGAPGYLGRYKVVRKIGAGGMGIVYLAEDQALKRLVAVKLLPPWLHGSSQANRRLLEEARAASAIDHPNIATIHEIGETEDGRLFITMSYYEGGTLRDRMATGPIPVDTAIDIALQIARGLAAAHRKGIVHRDIKPENVLVTADGMVKVADFGLASLELQATSPGTSPAGTAAYMSPEQARGAALDARTDVWSLGVVLYEMLAGARPSAETAVNESIDAAPAQLRAIVGRCLEKEPVARYASADQLVEHLRSVRAIIAGGSPNRDVMMQRSSRNRRARVVGGFAILTLAAIGTAAAWRNARDTNTPIVTQGVGASVAVLPFADMSPDSDREYISDGLTEELIHALAGIDGLRVISRSSVMQFQGKDIDVREAASKLGVAHILEGSVRSAKGRLRITLRLVDAARGDEVWSQVFDRTDADLLAVQGEIAGAVVTALRVKLGPADQVSLNHQADPRAHGLFLKGQRLFHQRQDLDRAVRFFREAIAIDPKFARAWTGLSRTWLIIPVYTTMPVPEALDSAETAVRTALSLDPNLADAHATLASMMADDWRWAESETHFLRALELSGGDATTHQWYGEMLFRTGRIDEAIARFKTAEQANPLQSVIPMVLGWAYLASQRTPEALGAFREATVLDPRDVQAHVGIGYSLLVLKRFSEAMPAFEKAVELTNGQQATRAHLARGYALSGRRPEAMKILEQLKVEAERGTGSAWGVAVVSASLGLEEEALRWLERGYQHREIGVGYLKTSEAFKPMRSHPGFVALLRKMGL